MAAAWYVLHSHANAETTCRAHLERQGFVVYLPCIRKRRRHARRDELVAAALFPRYLFVRLDPDRDRWRAVLSTVGVHTLLQAGNQPLAVADAVIDDIRGREDSDGFICLDAPDYTPGQPLRVKSGPFADLTGLYDGTDPERRIGVLLHLLGRPIRVSLTADTVEGGI